MSGRQLKYIILAGIFLIPFVPLIVSKSLFFPFITGKAFIFRTIAEIIFALWVILAMREKEYRPKFSLILGAVILFLAVVGVADILSENPFKSFWSNFERMEGYVGLLHFAAYFLVAGSMLKTREIWDKLLATSLGASVIMSIYSFLQLFGKIQINQGGVRVDGTFGNASYLGIYAVFHVFFAALLFTQTKNKIYRWLLAIAALMNVVVLYHTATRGAILGLLGGVLIASLYLIFKTEKGAGIKKIAVAGVVGVLILAGTLFAAREADFVKTNPVLSRFSSLSLSEIKTQGRYYVWPMAWKGFLERPILGWGQESFNFVFNKYYDPRMYNQEPWFDRTHNIFLDWLIAAGALGLISYLALYLSSLYHLRYFSSADKAVILGLLAAYFFHNIFVFDQIGSYILFFTLIGFLHANSPTVHFSWWDKLSAKAASISDKENYRPIIESFLVIGLISSLYFIIFVPWNQNKKILAVLRLNSESKVGEALVYSAPLKNYVLGFSEALEHVSQTAVGLAANKDASSELKQAVYQDVNAAFGKYFAKIPNDARYHLFYSMFLSGFGQYQEAAAAIEKAIEFSPRKQNMYFQLVNDYFILGEKEKALEAARTAYEAEPNYEEARMVYGLAALLSGKEELSNEILAAIPEEKLILDDRYVTVLQQLGRFDAIIAVMQKRSAIDPFNPQYKLNLAAAYLLAERRESAVAVLQEMIKDDPSFKENGEYYINEIRAGRNP